MRTLFVACGAVGCTAGLLVAAPAAQAGTTWGPAQEVSSKLGRAIEVADSGQVAVWIRTNSSYKAGPVRTSVYRSPKKGWAPSAEIPGTVGTTNVQLSGDGQYAFMKVPGTGYLMAQRSTGTTWGTAQPVVSGQFVAYGQMDAMAQTIVYVDFGPDPYVYPSVPVPIKVITKQADGTWSAPVVAGTVDSDSYDGSPAGVTLSSDGSTLAWLDETNALKASVRAADGTWSAPALLKQFPGEPVIGGLQLSADGLRLAYYNEGYAGDDGVVTTTRSGTTWSPLSYVTVDEVTNMALSPSGNTVAFSTASDKTVVLRQWNGTKWTKAKVMGSGVGYAAEIALTNKTLAWSTSYGKSLYTSVYSKGAWKTAVRVSKSAGVPALNSNGRTLIWGSPSVKKVYSVKR